MGDGKLSEFFTVGVVYAPCKKAGLMGRPDGTRNILK